MSCNNTGSFVWQRLPLPRTQCARKHLQVCQVSLFQKFRARKTRSSFVGFSTFWTTRWRTRKRTSHWLLRRQKCYRIDANGRQLALITSFCLYGLALRSTKTTLLLIRISPTKRNEILINCINKSSIHSAFHLIEHSRKRSVRARDSILFSRTITFIWVRRLI